MTKVYLAEISYYDTDEEEVSTIYLTDTAISPFGPSDPDRPNQYYDPVLIDPGVFRRQISVQANGLSSTSDYGSVVFSNADGVYDSLLNFGFDGRSIKILLGNKGDAWADYDTFIEGTIQQANFTYNDDSPSRVEITLRDKNIELDQSIQTNLFLGTNSGSTGVEGLESDIEGQPKPICYGEVKNASPVPVNTASLIFQIHDGSINAIDELRDEGIVLTLGSDRADLAALQGASISSGYYDTCLAEGYIRLGASPSGTITCDVQGDNTGSTYRTTAADITKHIVETYAGFVSADINSTSFTDLNTANSAVVGVYIDSENFISEVIAELLKSIGATYCFGNDGKICVQRIEVPTGTADLELDQNDTVDVERIPNALPVWRCNLGYEKNYTAQRNADLAGGVSIADRLKWGQQYRYKSNETASVQTAHPLAPVLNKDTLLVSSSAADTESARLQMLFGTARDQYRVAIPMDSTNIAAAINTSVELTLNRFGLGAGKKFLVIGYESHTPSNGLMTLTLWG